MDQRTIGSSTNLRWTASDYSRVPYGVYVDEDVFQREQEKIFRGPTWSYLGLEAEIQNPGSFITSYVGDTPVVLTRNAEGRIKAFVNRCAHRGATVCRERHGATKRFLCVYHQWSYSLDGDLVGVPYIKGIRGAGGMPDDFDRAANGLQKLRVESYQGVVFATFSDKVEPLAEFLDKPLCKYLDRLFEKPITVLGYARQVVPANWKLYCENTKDPYHGALLHLFHATFGMYRSTQVGGVDLDKTGMHSAIHARIGTDDSEALTEAVSDTRFNNLEKGDDEVKLRDPSVLAGCKEFEDGISTLIVQAFPSVVIQQITNTLATRKIIPHAVDEFELLWTYFGYVDDDAEMEQMRLKQANLIGPAGYISMEDGEAARLIQDNAAHSVDRQSLLEMGGVGEIDSIEHLVTETSIRGMWREYCRLMGFEVT